MMSMPEVSYQTRADAGLGVLDEYLVFSRANLHSSKAQRFISPHLSFSVSIAAPILRRTRAGIFF